MTYIAVRHNEVVEDLGHITETAAQEAARPLQARHGTGVTVCVTDDDVSVGDSVLVDADGVAEVAS